MLKEREHLAKLCWLGGLSVKTNQLLSPRLPANAIVQHDLFLSFQIFANLTFNLFIVIIITSFSAGAGGSSNPSDRARPPCPAVKKLLMFRGSKQGRIADGVGKLRLVDGFFGPVVREVSWQIIL